MGGDKLMPDDEVDFVSMQAVYNRGYSIATLATAIEKVGLLGQDRYGRWTFSNEKNAEHVVRALDALAARYSKEAQQDGWQPSDDEPLGNPWYECGWRSDEQPAFDDIQRGLEPAPRVKGTTKSNNANINIIGTLVGVLDGTLQGLPKDFVYESDAKFFDIVCPLMEGYAGLSRRNMQDKFAEGRHAIGLHGGRAAGGRST
ncbi:hypothetical protein [Aquabacterium humicola]|uniref:hypothetical protein n=1 Tax=Aquabacterium humicola TaxID=3237377 RepID=UPI002542BA47|nr:hypothetical protein [Rubrivivax pictus]